MRIGGVLLFVLQFPSATIQPSTFDAYFAELNRARDKLPVVTSEIGDTWIYGIASDPLKNTQYRAMARARWGEGGACACACVCVCACVPH